MSNGYGLLEVLDTIFIDLKTNKPAFFLDYCKMSNLNIESSEIVQTAGKGLPEVVAWDVSKVGTVEIQDGLVDPKKLAHKSGTELKKGKAKIYEREYLVATAGTADKTTVTLKHTPLSEGLAVYVSEDGYAHGEEVTGTISTGNIEFDATDVPIGEDVLVYYFYESTETAEQVTVSSDSFAGNYRVIGKTFMKDPDTGVNVGFQVDIPNGKLNSNFTLTMDSSTPSVIDFNLKLMKGKGSTDMVLLTKYDV